MPVALFITCLTDTFYPRVGEAVVRVLRHYQCAVSFPAEQTCCGQPFWNSGATDEARSLARRMVNVFRGYDAVVTPSASCAAFVRHRLPELLEHEAAARRLAEQTWEFAAFLEQRLGVDLAAALRLREPTTYHFPCHARELSTANDLQRWLSGGVAPRTGAEPGEAQPLPAARLHPPARPELCCGFGGAFATDFPEVSAAMLEEKLADLQATHARCVVCNEGGCTLQLAGGARRSEAPLRFTHLAELLAESLELMEPPA